jgi:hypothetical protein
MQPPYVPPSPKFEIDDANDDWTFREKFDFIHCRQLHMVVEEKRPFQQSLEALKPGGWFEIKEIALPLSRDDHILEGTALAQWQDAMMEASRIVKREGSDSKQISARQHPPPRRTRMAVFRNDRISQPFVEQYQWDLG